VDQSDDIHHRGTPFDFAQGRLCYTKEILTGKVLCGWTTLSHSFREHGGLKHSISAVGFAAMADAANLYRVRIWADKQEAVISDAQP